MLQSDKKKLKCVKQLVVNKKHFKCKEYWLSDTHNNLVTFSINLENNLLVVKGAIPGKLGNLLSIKKIGK
jgi:hypothetical protein